MTAPARETEHPLPTQPDCRTALRRLRTGSGELPAMVNTQGFFDWARAQGMAALLYEWAAPDRHRLHPDFARFARQQATLEALREPEVARVTTAFAAAGLPCLLIKGAALATRLYPRSYTRFRDDTDLLVAETDRRAAIDQLASLDYRVPEAIGPAASGQCHALFRDHNELVHGIDLHWRLSNPLAFASRLGFDEMWRQSVPVPGIAAARGPCELHALLHALLHRIAHHAERDRLIWLYDIDQLYRALDAPGQRSFLELARDRGLASICADGLVRARDWFDTPVREQALAQLSGGNDDTRAYLGGDMSRGQLWWRDFRALPGTPARMRWLYAHLFPSAGFMREQFPHQRSWPLAGLYLWRLGRGIRRARSHRSARDA
ncbi:MAG: nucleotidyltransferase family protein [Gammaproteobacteria bacterium]|nr:nucleotidyltransferase family protein [Gammaproteobacteria bacterium]